MSTIAGGIRLTWRLVAVTLWTGGLFFLRVAIMPLASVAPGKERKCRMVLFRTWGLGLARIIGMKIRVYGTAPKPPFFLVCNHLSHIDAYLLCGLLGCTFVAKSEVASWPVLGFMAKRLNIIFVNREKAEDAVRVNRLIDEALARGEGLVMFAESKTSRGLTIQPFKSALLEPVVRSSIPAHYATIHYSAPEGTPPADAWVCWWDGTPFLSHVLRLLAKPGFEATVMFGHEPVTALDRKQLARDLWHECIAQFQPVGK